MKNAAPLLAAVAALLLGAPPATAQDTTFSVATVGDSITEGDSDTRQQCLDHKDDPGPNCGYPRRLAGLDPIYDADPDYAGRSFDCGGSEECEIVNWGISSQRVHDPNGGIPAMVTWIDTVLADRPWDAVIVMGGTNDINSRDISLDTLLADLDLMAEKAVEAGTEPVHASIIRFHPDRLGAPDPAEDEKVDDFRTELRDLALAEGRYFADPWLRLCPQNRDNEYHRHTQDDCFELHYRQDWLLGDPVGHPEQSGYDVIARAMYEELAKTPIPGPPSPTAPQGDVACAATFTWEREAPERATWYQLEVDGVAAPWEPVGDACTGPTCSLAAPETYGPGPHTWRVRGRNPRGWGSWASASFEIADLTAPAPVAPAGDAGPFGPTYVWDESPGATAYRLVVTGPEGTLVDESYDPSVCDGGTCSATPAASPGRATYTWHVEASNDCATTVGGTLEFTFWPRSVPDLLAPKTETFDASPTFRWTDSGALTYRLLVDDGSTVDESFDDSICAGGECSAVAALPGVGSYVWRIEATNPVETVATADEPFDVVDCGEDEVLVEGVTIDADETVRACRSIVVVGPGGAPVRVAPTGSLLLHSGGTVTAWSGLSVEVGGELVVLVEP